MGISIHVVENVERNMIKVANIIEEGHLGGPQLRIIQVAERLYNQGIDTTIILPKVNSSTFQERLQQKHIKYRTLPLHHLTKEKIHLIKYVSFFFFELWVLYRFLKRERFDVVHVSGSWQFKGVIAGRLAGAKVIWHLNNTSTPRFLKVPFKLIANFLTISFIVAGSRVKRYYLNDIKFNEDRVFEIQAPVDCDKFNPKIVEPDLWITTFDKIKIVTVANINPTKNLEHFIQMAYILNEKFNNLSFWIVGPTYTNQKKYRMRLEKLIEQVNMKNVHFYGSCKDVGRILKVADIYVCSSIAEASPLSVWEAMAMEKPIVSTDVGDVSKFIKNGKNGFIVPVKNPELLAQRVEKYIHEPERAQRFGIFARKIAREKLDLNICVQKHKNAYETIIKV